MLALPIGITTCLFDLDGVLTQTARIHAQAWKQMFDEFLRDRAERAGEPFEPFDRPTDYDEYVDGLPRLDGVLAFLASRGIELPIGSPSDPPEAENREAISGNLCRCTGYENIVKAVQWAARNGSAQEVGA